MKKTSTALASLAFVMTAYFTQACGTNTAQESAPKKIVGANDLTPVQQDSSNIPAEYRDLIEAIGVISMGCTGTHIGGGYVVTAGHCFQNIMEEENSAQIQHTKCYDSEKNDVKIGWGYRSEAGEGKHPFSLVSKCVEVIEAELTEARDFAIFRVDQAPSSSVDMDFSRHVARNTEITIFSHPKTRPLEWSKDCTVKTAANMSMDDATKFTYSCDTEPGSSGAAVIDVASRTIIGVHNGGGENVDGVIWNYATYSDAIANPKTI